MCRLGLNTNSVSAVLRMRRFSSMVVSGGVPSTRPTAVEMGPLVTRVHLDRVRGYIDRGIAEGAELVVDGRGLRMDRAGFEQGEETIFLTKQTGE